jgi:hypothetical protein
MNKNFFLATLLFCLSISVFAGNDITEKRYTYLSLGTGYSQFRMIDRKVSPLIYSSSQSPNWLSFANITENSIFKANLNFVYNFTSPDEFKERSFIFSSPNHNGVIREDTANFFKSSLIQDELTVEYLRLISANETGKLKLYFGGQLKQYFSYSSTQAPVFVFSEISLNPSLLMRYRFSDTFESQSGLSVPLASLITQMPYSNDPTDGKHNYLISTFLMGSNFASLNRFQRINFHQSLQKRFNHRWAVALDYDFYWFHYRNNSDINAYDNSVTVKLLISLNSKK